MFKNRRKWLWGGLIIFLVIVIFWGWQVKKVDNYNLALGSRPFLGKAEAGLVVQEFSDFQCPACRIAQPVIKEILANYGNEIKLEYKHFPLITVHFNAFRAALASECANDQGKFWPYHDWLFANQNNLSYQSLLVGAKALALDEKDFKVCLDNRKHSELINSDMRLGEKIGVEGTPTFVLDGQRFYADRLEEVIKQKLGR